MGGLEGTEIFDLVPGHGSSDADDLVCVDDRIFFTARDAVAKQELLVLEDTSIFSDGFENGDTAAWDQ